MTSLINNHIQEFIQCKGELFLLYSNPFGLGYLVRKWIPKEFEVGNSDSDVNNISIIFNNKRYVPVD